MLFPDTLVVVRGGGDLGSGAIARLHRAGFPVVVLELAAPLTVRRTVAFSSAVTEGEVTVEGIVGRRVDRVESAPDLAASGVVAVAVCSSLPDLPRQVVVDARLAKRNLDTRLDDAPLVVALGPGFSAGADCHAVVETARGHHLGRVLWHGAAAANTGLPGEVGGHGADRVLRAPVGGGAAWHADIGDVVRPGQLLGSIGGAPVFAPFHGVVRGLITPGTRVAAGTKVGDIDPRLDTRCDEISDKSLAIGGGVLEAVLTWMSARS